jgi:acyl carrier protein
MAYSSQEIMEKLKKILVEEFELELGQLTPDSNLYVDLGLDSLDSVDLVVALEKEFKFKINREQDEEKIRAIRTLTDIVAFIELKQAQVTGQA